MLVKMNERRGLVSERNLCFSKGDGMSEHFWYEQHILRLPEFQGVVEKAVRFFEETPALELPPPRRFPGCGVYALYYLGNLEIYAPLAEANQSVCWQPIYVGKAVPPGRRRGRTTSSDGAQLYARLREHVRSIGRAVGLKVSDFRCRFMILEGELVDLIVPVESELIRRYKPLWNTVIDGFGNHDPGSGRYDQAPSEWDVLHPGRPWVEKLTGRPPDREGIVAKVRQHLAELSLSYLNDGFV